MNERMKESGYFNAHINHLRQGLLAIGRNGRQKKEIDKYLPSYFLDFDNFMKVKVYFGGFIFSLL